MTRLVSRARNLVGRVVLRAYLRSDDPIARIIHPDSRPDPYPVYDEVRSRGRVVATRADGVFVSADHEVCTTVLQDERFQHRPLDDRGAALPLPRATTPLSPSMLDLDPPDHTRLRGLVSQAFRPRAIERLRADVEVIAGRLIDAHLAEGRFDLMTDFAAPLPVTVICEILGVPHEDRPTMFRWGQVVGASLDPIRTASFQRELDEVADEMAVYFRRQLDQRRRQPEDDVLQAMVDAEIDGDVLSERELIATCVLLLVAGFETTVNLIGNGVQALLDHPDQLAHLRAHPDAIGNAVEELLRFDSPVQYSGRIAREPLDLHGTAVPRNGYVYTVIGGANRDPGVFQDPHALDVTRPNARRHLSFASGIHYCLGASLARMEGEVAVRTLLERLAEMRPAGTGRRRPLTLLRGYASLPLAFTPAPRVGGGA
jgi:cytochrome P450